MWERSPVGRHPRTQRGARGVTALASRSGILSPLPWQGEGSNLGFPLFPFASSFLIYRFHFFGGQQPGRDPGLFWRSGCYPFLFIPKGSPIPCATVIYFFSSPLIFFPPNPPGNSLSKGIVGAGHRVLLPPSFMGDPIPQFFWEVWGWNYTLLPFHPDFLRAPEAPGFLGFGFAE